MTTTHATLSRPSLISTRGFHLGHIVLPDWCRDKPPLLVKWGSETYVRNEDGDYIETFTLWLNPKDVRG